MLNSLKEGSLLTNGLLLRLESLKETEERLELKVALTNYKEWKATCIQKNKRRFEEKNKRPISKEESASTFASATLPVTLDNYVVFLERTKYVAEFKEFLNLPSGGKWDGNPEYTYNTMLRVPKDLFRRCGEIVTNEFKRTLCLQDDSQKLFGVIETLDYDDHVLMFQINLNSSSNDIQKAKDLVTPRGSKYQDIVLVEFDESKLADFLNKNKERIPSSIFPVAVISGAHKFGEDWPLSIRGVKKR